MAGELLGSASLEVHTPRLALNSDALVLNSWKEIAQYLGRGVRTVQRWERDLQLPVHRIGKGKRSPVYANVRELKFWFHTSAAARNEGNFPDAPDAEVILRRQKGETPIENSRRLLLSVRALTEKIAEASVRQRRQAEELQARIIRMRDRVG